MNEWARQKSAHFILVDPATYTMVILLTTSTLGIRAELMFTHSTVLFMTPLLGYVNVDPDKSKNILIKQLFSTEKKRKFESHIYSKAV
jgi:hypothetical protein